MPLYWWSSCTGFQLIHFSWVMAGHYYCFCISI
jgi:hypothetical protein